MADYTVKYDYLIVGAGLFGATFANRMREVGRTCLVIDKAPHIAGNCYTEKRDGITLHMYGPHIFHTDNKEVWNYAQRFTDFLPYKHTGIAKIGSKLYSLPINLTTMNKIWPDVDTPVKAQKKLEEVRTSIQDPANFEEVALNTIGEQLYTLFISGYTQKQWGRSPRELPASIFNRLPVRTSMDNNYFFHKHQGIPKNGYTAMVSNMLNGIPVLLNTDFFLNRAEFINMARKVIYTGPIDKFYNYRFGNLEYRSLKFNHHRLMMEDFQGHSIVNYPELDIPYTRVTEHKHFEGVKSEVTWVTQEYPLSGEEGPPLYPINDDANNTIYSNYKMLANKEKNVLFGGRLASYRYYDMDQVIKEALDMAHKEIQK